MLVLSTQAEYVSSLVIGQLINIQNVRWRDIDHPHFQNTSGCVFTSSGLYSRKQKWIHKSLHTV